MKEIKMKNKVRFKKLWAFLFTVVISLTFSACSKDEDGGNDVSTDYYFRAAIDGRKVDFHTVNFQGGGNDNRWEHIVVGGYETSYPASGQPIPPSLDFEIWKLGGNIAEGTYSTPAEEKMIARYAVQTSDGTLLYNTSFANDVFTLKIESIGKQGIKGTFSGTVRNMAGTAISITDGSFNLPYQTIINP
ncbi:hypothetical protein GCM10009120_50570 [Sphingobacterium siyangense subsp. cladoniae]|uniref:hypothetical protein n=1 Tax=Sphingobacterium siyangense TaxID=459529 RepID=UPI0031F7E238